MGAEVTRGKDRKYLLKNNSNNTYYIILSSTNFAGFCWQDSKHACKAITVKLGSLTRINHIQLLLAEFQHSGVQNGSFKYSVYGSTNDSDGWTCLVEHKEYQCRSWQHLYFPSCTLQYIRLVNTGVSNKMHYSKCSILKVEPKLNLVFSTVPCRPITEGFSR